MILKSVAFAFTQLHVAVSSPQRNVAFLQLETATGHQTFSMDISELKEFIEGLTVFHDEIRFADSDEEQDRKLKVVPMIQME